MYKYKIAHIADIHIKNKYIEYYNLLDLLHNEKPDIIVIAGDVVDSVININPSIILDVTTFLSSLISIAPIVMIPGNHDISCKVDDIDFFTAITYGNDILKPPRFNYWRHSGQYMFKDIIWTVIVPDEDIPEFTFDIRPQILLFHENLDRLNIDNFNIFTAVMAGHLHSRQLIGNNGAYSGSLFQQNINESHNDHGIVIWELMNNFAQPKFVDIYNNYGFLKVELESDSDVTSLPIPEKVVLYDIYYSNTTIDFLNKVIETYVNKYGFKPRNVKDKNKYNIDNLNNRSLGNSLGNSTVNINDISTHNTLIRHYLKNLNDDKKIQNIIDIHKKYYTMYYNFQDSNNGKVRLLKLFFENMYNFQGPNYIDFTKLEKKISGVVGPNNIGKTALIDIILYALYDVHPRISSKKSIINKNCTSYNLNLEFEINGKFGIITKGTQYKIVFDGKDLTQKTIPLTINEIRKIVGTYNDAIISSFQLQYNYNNFVNMSSNMRKQKLAEILSLHVFENIEAEIIKEISEMTGKQKIINSLKITNEFEVDESKIKDIQHQIRYTNLLGIDSSKTDKDEIKYSIKFYEDMVKIKQNIDQLENERNILYAIINENKSLIVEYPNAIEDHKKYIEESKKINDIITEINKKIEEFEPKYIKDAVINKFNDFGISYLYKLCKVEKDKDKITLPAAIISCLLLEKDHNIKLYDSYCAKIILCEKVIQQINHSVEIDKINKIINEMKDKYNNMTNSVNSTNKLYLSLYEEYKKYIQKDIEIYRQCELEKINNDLELLKLYRQVIKPSNGIISILLANIIPKLETKANEFLNHFDIKIKIDDDFDIFYDVNGYWLDISLSSGYQKFILNIIFRLILWQFADVIVPNAIIIDEGFGMCDNENISTITDMLHYITKCKDMPCLLFIVSHVNYLVDNIEAPLFIENGKIVTQCRVRFSENNLDEIVENNLDEIVENNLDEIVENNLDEIVENNEKNIPQYPIDNLILDKNLCDDDRYYCDNCNVYVKVSSKHKHLSSQKHKNNVNKI
jgi:DNA repair exonuclease SbcCD ATPase subunit